MELKNIFIRQCIKEQYWMGKRISDGMRLLIYGRWQLHFITRQLASFRFDLTKGLEKIKLQWEKWQKIDQKVQYQQRSQDQ